ncbi:MAG: dTMP kinase [Candidatus Zixiibacteriota bacterium]|nr:MAG: dTMP kinase [candidate division Zixibacteria bacterium]
MFVTFEGIDGCGKSTQARLTYQHLLSHKRKVKLLREPGSTVVAEKIRDILLNRKLRMTPQAELLLYEAARAELMAKEITPALAGGSIVLCDRFYDSTTAYQGFGRRLDVRMVKGLHKVAVGRVVPDLTFVFDVDLKTAFARRGRSRDRLESESTAFHNRVRLGFLEIARKERRRVKLIDATAPVDEVFRSVKKYLLKKLDR